MFNVAPEPGNKGKLLKFVEVLVWYTLSPDQTNRTKGENKLELNLNEQNVKATLVYNSQ